MANIYKAFLCLVFLSAFTGHARAQENPSSPDTTQTNWIDYNDSIGNIEPGEYYILFREVGSGCVSDTASFDIQLLEQPAAPVATAQSFCAGSVVADLEAECPDSTQLLWYASADSDTVLSDSIELESGIYYAAAKSSGGCESEKVAVQVTVNPLLTPELSIYTEDTLICEGESASFTAELSPSEINVSEYQWFVNNQEAGSNNATFTSSDLNNDDEVSCRVIVHGDCLADTIALSNVISIKVIPQITFAVTDTTSYGDTSGTVVLSGLETGKSYAYQLDGNNWQSYATYISGLEEGGHQIKVREEGIGCESDTVGFSINLTDSITFGLDVLADVTILGGNDGSVRLTNVAGGVGSGYTVQLNDNPAVSITDSLTIDTLSSGTYTLQVFDGADNASALQTFEIGQPSTFTFDAHVAQHETNAGVADGVIVIDSIYASQTLSFEYTKDNRATWVSIEQGDSITGLTAGDYTIILRADGVESVPETFTIEQTCSSYTVSINDLTDCDDTIAFFNAVGLDPDKQYQYLLIPKGQGGKPTITLLGDNPLTWTLGETFIDPGATAYDDKDGDITESIVVTDNIDINTEGTYQITYNVTDSDGNVAEEVVRTVLVEDIDWAYEGIMTVGFDGEKHFGWADIDNIDSGFSYGVLNPSLTIDYYIAEITYQGTYLGIFVQNSSYISIIQSIDKVYINGIIYNDFAFDSSRKQLFIKFIENNPFPPVGETCEIKLKYTLAEAQFEEVTIGTQTWMAVNLDIDDGLGGIYAYYGDESKVATYGRLYTWDAAMRIADSINGWHLPSDDEWTTLINYLGGESVAGGKLKEAGTTHWTFNSGATNESGFTALPGGHRFSETAFLGMGSYGHWWSSTETDATYAWHRQIQRYFNRITNSAERKSLGFSVRLIKDYSHTPTITLLGDSSVTITVGDTYEDAGATATDTRYGNITSDIVVVNNVNTSVAGTYTVTYNITTEDGYVAEEVVREVIVEEIIAPEQNWEEVTIGTQTWMKYNLVIDDGGGGIYAYNNDEGNVATYGRLYTWDAAMRVANSIDGWHLPSNVEWALLETYLGGNSVAGGKLKETGTEHWDSPNTGATNETGFTALPGGYRYGYNGAFNYIGKRGFLWSATESNVSSAYYRGLNYDINDLYSYGGLKGNGFSVRLVKDYSHTPTITLLGDSHVTINVGDTYTDAGATASDTRYGDITSDIITVNNVNTSVAGTYTVTYNITTEDGYVAEEVVREVIVEEIIAPEQNWEEVTIGTQTWMAANLDIDDGGGGIYAYNNDEGNVATYGRLYTWAAAVRVANSIDGWHLPSDAEWTTLTDYLGGTSVAGGKLKEAGTTHWDSPNAGATNETGFTALPGGGRDGNGAFGNIGSGGRWWSVTDYSVTYARSRRMFYNDSNVGSMGTDKATGYSVRLIKD